MTHWIQRLYQNETDSTTLPAHPADLLVEGEWSEIDRTNAAVAWSDAPGDVVAIGRTGDDAPDVEEAKAIAAARDGALIAFTEGRGPRGAVIDFIYKFWVGTGYGYTGMVFLPGPEGAFVVTISASEHGTSGLREALVVSQLIENGELSPETYESRWFSDPFDQDHSGPCLRSISDDEQYDAEFPWNPLSKVRRVIAAQRAILESPSS